MKKIIIFSLILAGTMLGSCKKYLSIQPQQTLGDNLVVTNLPGLQSAVTASFSQMQSGNLYGGGIIANTELWADFIKPGTISDFSLSQFVSHQFNIYNSQGTGLWTDGYHAILIANTALKYLPNFNSQNHSLVNKLMGESYFVRAIMHYEILREFAQPSGYTTGDNHLGIPIRLTPASSVTDGQSTPRSTVAQVYAQIVSDLMKADSLLPYNTQLDSSIYVTKYTAMAYLTKVYFSQNKFTQAEQYADSVIEKGGFTLNSASNIGSPYTQLGASGTTPETIFEIINLSNDVDYSSLNGRFSVPPFGSTVPIYQMSSNLLSLLVLENAQASGTLGDARDTLYTRTGLCKKYNSTYANVTVIRLAEILLTRAECEAQNNDYNGALNDLNQVRERARLADQTSTGQTLITAIRTERAVELAMEGDHYFEVKRIKGVFNCTVGNFSWNDPTMIYPIPAQEINENKAMVQNPGY